ncbi:hypothetical protein PG996_009344 [Apiospora saccharicola]|uniref:Uncharacterized protein n=1 Tax=Apiospora saccharicola TaxID=335842 RepID=A0ABR1UKG9_9PEZI
MTSSQQPQSPSPKYQPWTKWFQPEKDADKVPNGPHKAVEVHDDAQNGNGPVDITATEFELHSPLAEYLIFID